MTKEEKDHLVETEDLLTDCIYDSLDWEYDGGITIENFIEEFKSRTKLVQIKALYDLMGPKSRTEFEEMMSELYKIGAR